MKPLDEIETKALKAIEARVQKVVAKQRDSALRPINEKLARYETAMRERYLAEYMAAARKKQQQ
jgi:hypothetical protein